MKNKNKLVKGSAGFIGNNSIDFLIENNNVTAIDKLSSVKRVFKFNGSLCKERLVED